MIALLVTAPAFARPADPASPEVSAPEQGAEDVIVITAARTKLPKSALPMTVDIIDNKALNEQLAIGGSAVDAVAALTPSFSPTRQKLTGTGETLRGRSPLYAINGIPQSTPLRDSSRDGFSIDPFFIDRVEVIFGSNALQGIGATGGIVNQVTVGAPSHDGFSGRTLVQLTGDSEFSRPGMGWKLAGLASWRGGRFDATAGAAFERRGMYRDGRGRLIGVDTIQGDTQDSNSLSLFGRFGVDIDDSLRVELMASRFNLKSRARYVELIGNRDQGIPASSVLGKVAGVPAANNVETLSLTLTDSDLWGGLLTGQLFFNRNHDTFGGGAQPTFQDVRIAPLGTLYDQSENRSRKYGGKVSYERAIPGLEALTATLGLDYLADRTAQMLIATDRTWVPETNYRSLSPFVQANLKLFDGKLRLAGGTRYENVEIAIPDFTTLAYYGGHAVKGGSPRFSNWLLNGGVILEPISGVRAYASYAEGYTVPDVGRITRAINKPGVEIGKFLSIRPIISNNREVGVEVKRGPVEASAAYFWSSSQEGQFLVLKGQSYEVARQPVAIEGLEVNLATRLPLEGLKAHFGYAGLQGRTDNDGDGKYDADLDGGNISPDRVNLALSYARGPLSARVQQSYYLARTFHGCTSCSNFSGYALTDLFARYDTGYGALTLGVANIFDRDYIGYDSQTTLYPKTNPNYNGRYFAGRGRSMTLGWDWRF